jgi:hypothetical protein
MTMASSIKTDGPELALQRTIFDAVVASGLDVRDSVSVLANVFAGIVDGSAAPVDVALRYFTRTVVKRLEIERASRNEPAPHLREAEGG